MPGMAASHTVIYNEGLLKRFVAYLDAGELDMGHVLAYPAVEAAYTQGDEWLEQCLAYVQGNIAYVEAYLRENLPVILRCIILLPGWYSETGGAWWNVL